MTIFSKILCWLGLHDWEYLDSQDSGKIYYRYFTSIEDCGFAMEDNHPLNKKVCLKCGKKINEIKDYHLYCQEIIDNRERRKKRAEELYGKN